MKRQTLQLVFIISVMFLSCLQACENESQIPFSVVTEEVLYVSGERVVIVGRLLSLGKEPIQDHGIQISSNENFSSPIIISLGNRSKPGRFVADFSGLQLNNEYFCRSFVEIESKVFYGNVLPFKTLLTDIVDFSPKIGSAGDKLVITGKNFTENTEVFIDGKKVEVTELLFESQLTVLIPPLTDEYQVRVSVKIQDQELIFDDHFEYEIGKWEKVGDFVSSIQLQEAISFKDTNKFIFGLGRTGNPINSSIWELDLENFTWTEINYSGAGLAGAFSTGGYFGSGVSLFSQFGTIISRDFWYYKEGIFTQKEDLPFTLYKSIGFIIGDNLYVLGGTIDLRINNRNIYQYNITQNVWQIVSQVAPELSSEITNFTFENNQYFVLANSIILKYSTQTNDWGNEAIYPISNFGVDGISAVIEDKVFIGLGSSRELWQFEPRTLKWKRKTPFPSGGSFRNLAYFIHNNFLYVLRRPSGQFAGQNPIMSLWKFDPNSW